MKKVKVFPATEKIKRKFTIFSVNTKIFHMLKIATVSFVLRAHEITDILVSTSKKVNFLYSYHPYQNTRQFAHRQKLLVKMNNTESVCLQKRMFLKTN